MKKPAQGSTARWDGKTNRYRRTMVGFDEDVFAEIRGRAVTQHTSFAEQVRLLVEWGLEEDERARAGL